MHIVHHQQSVKRCINYISLFFTILKDGWGGVGVVEEAWVEGGSNGKDYRFGLETDMYVPLPFWSSWFEIATEKVFNFANGTGEQGVLLFWEWFVADKLGRGSSAGKVLLLLLPSTPTLSPFPSSLEVCLYSIYMIFFSFLWDLFKMGNWIQEI